MNNKKQSEKNKSLCSGCDACCQYIATEIDKPTTPEEIQNIYWFLLHKNVGVYIGFNNKWYLEFLAPCKKLKNKLCSDYDNRPDVCRDYKQTTCPKYLKSPTEKKYFHNEKEFFSFVKKKMSRKLWITLVDAKKI